jgi:hypothetical protein
MSEGRETTVGCILWTGVALIAIGFILFMFGMFRGFAAFGISGAKDPTAIIEAPFLLIPSVLGMIMALGALGYGIWQGKREYKPTGNRRLVENARIMARYVYNNRGEMLTEEYQWDGMDDVKFYVKIETPGEQPQEYQCVQPVYETCGEGMIGQATVDGRWLGAFSPYLGKQGAVDRGALSPDVGRSYDADRSL